MGTTTPSTFLGKRVGVGGPIQFALSLGKKQQCEVTSTWLPGTHEQGVSLTSPDHSFSFTLMVSPAFCQVRHLLHPLPLRKPCGPKQCKANGH